MKKIVILALLLVGMGANAQLLIDNDIERIACGALAQEISYSSEDAIRYAGVVVMEVATGNVVANVSLCYKNGEFLKDPNRNMEYVPLGLGRSVLYLSMV